MGFIVRKTWLTGRPIGTEVIGTFLTRDSALNTAEALSSIYKERSYDAVLDCWVAEDADQSVVAFSVERAPLS